MIPEIHSGYLGLFRPPYTLDSKRGTQSTIYCISTQNREVLVLIPLVPSFFADLYKFVSRSAATRYYIIAPDISIPFISDYYLSWDYIHRKLGHVCKIFTKFPIENYGSQEFLTDVEVLPEGTVNFSLLRNRNEDATINVKFTTRFVGASNPFACHVDVTDTIKHRLFATDMNDRLAQFLMDNREIYDEVHIPFITGNYDGMTYNELIKKYPFLYQKIFINQFASKTEFDDAAYRKLNIGRLYR